MLGRIAFALLVAAGVVGAFGDLSAIEESPVYEAYAVRYAKLPDVPVAFLVQNAEPGRKVDLAMTLWVLKGPDGRIVLVDAGLYRPKVLKEYEGISEFTRPDKALEKLGIKPEDVTDVVVTHMHSDHADGVDLFPKAVVWIQKDEFDYYTREAKENRGKPEAKEDEFITALLKLNDQGRVRMVEGDDKQIVPGVKVYTGGRHTYASQYVGVNTKAGCMIIASDNVYLYENLDKHVAIATTFDAKANLAAQDRMKKLAASPSLIIPGHDPEVFVRFPKPGEGVARLD